MALSSKRDRFRPWEKLGMSRKEYAAAKPWKHGSLTRKQFEELLEAIPDHIIQDIRREGQAEALVEAIFGALDD